MKAKQIIYTWDYHHGQATRVITAGLPPLRGADMQAKQEYFQAHHDHIRTSMMQEARGHRNMLGAILTDPATEDGDIGMLFLSPQGFFEMCGDSTFSATAALIDSGMFHCDTPDGNMLLKVDTVAGRVDVHVEIMNAEPVGITFDNVPSYSLGVQALGVPGYGEVETMLSYGGLNYAFVNAADLGIDSLCDFDRDKLLAVGTAVWRAAREQTSVPSYVGEDRLGAERPVDLITLGEPLTDVKGARVANFYAPNTTGRTPSGTGLSARTAIEVAAGRVSEGETFIHESLLGLQFKSVPKRVNVPAAELDVMGIIPAITARSFLMGTAQWVLHPEDPFTAGFVF